MSHDTGADIEKKIFHEIQHDGQIIVSMGNFEAYLNQVHLSQNNNSLFDPFKLFWDNYPYPGGPGEYGTYLRANDIELFAHGLAVYEDDLNSELNQPI